MSIIIKTLEEIEILREGGKRLATVLYKVKNISKAWNFYERFR